MAAILIRNIMNIYHFSPQIQSDIFYVFMFKIQTNSRYPARKFEAHNHSVLCVVWNLSSLKFMTMKRFCGCAIFCSMINSQFRTRDKLTACTKNKKWCAFKINYILAHRVRN